MRIPLQTLCILGSVVLLLACTLAAVAMDASHEEKVEEEQSALVVFQPSLLSSFYEAEKVFRVGGCIDREIKLTQAGHGTGATSWPASVSLASHLADDPFLENLFGTTGWTWEGRTVVELGSGLGLMAVVLHLLGANVHATDGEASVVENIRHNIAQNLAHDASNTLPTVHVHRWGDALPRELPPKVDVIVAADVVYGDDPSVWELLLDSIRGLSATNEDVTLIMSHTTRYAAEERFFHRLRRSFTQIGASDLKKYLNSNTKLMAFRKRPS